MNDTTKSKFIVFEGGEGTGKTTQIEKLVDRLNESGQKTFLTREPGGTDCEIAEKIRDLIKDPNHSEMVPETEFFLFLASRAQHVQKVILPKIEQGIFVICDRFHGSTFAYQHFARGLFNLDEMKAINKFATKGLEPHLTLLLDIQPEIGLQRISSRRNADRLDSEALDFHHRVRNGYLELAKTHPNWKIVNATQDIETIHSEIWNHVLLHL